MSNATATTMPTISNGSATSSNQTAPPPSSSNAAPSSTATPASKVPSSTPNAQQSTSEHPPIILRSPKGYSPTMLSSTDFNFPTLEWLQGTWSVTHSTLPMWRKAKNVRITYKIIAPTSPEGPTLLDDEVCSEPIARTLLPQPKSIKGIDTPDGEGGWNWRGKGWLKIASSHWQVLGWGERGDQRWVVTYFAPSLFTPAGLDIYSNKKEGIGEALYTDIFAALEGLESRDMAMLVKSEMREVKIEY